MPIQAALTGCVYLQRTEEIAGDVVQESVYL